MRKKILKVDVFFTGFPIYYFLKNFMRINSLQISAPSNLRQSKVAVQQYEKLSGTDWKTYFLVISCHLLIGFGVILAFASLYFFTIVNPMIALTSPVIPIALGVLGITSSHPKNEEPLFKKNKLNGVNDEGIKVPFMQGQPIGLQNESANCWINSIFQMIANLPDYKEALNNIFQGSNEELKNMLQPLMDAVKTYDLERNAEQDFLNQVSSVDTQFLRLWLCEVNDKLKHRKNCTDPSEQFDAFEDFMIFFLEKINHQAPTMSQKEVVKIRKNIFISEKEEDSKKNPFHFFNLPLGDHINKSVELQDLFNTFFSSTKNREGPKNTETAFYFKSPPKDMTLNISHPLATDNIYSEKSEEKVNLSLPLIYVSNSEQFGAKAIYRCDGFAKHAGKTIGNGHYVAFIHRLGKWWRLNDSKVTVVSENTIKDELKTASIVHYTMVKK